VRAIDLTGKVIGRWTVLRRAENNAAGGTQWECRCECDTIKTIGGAVLRDGRSQSCGCRKIDIVVTRSTKHGHSPSEGGVSRTYSTWAGMVQRCTDSNQRAWKNYGGRGIRVCERWLKFENFLADMGEKPEGRTLERTENDGNYEPGNCVWATPGEQSRNRRANRMFELKGRQVTLTDASAELGLDRHTIPRRLKRAWPLDRALDSLDGRVDQWSSGRRPRPIKPQPT
jgi:hypothetical protein